MGRPKNRMASTSLGRNDGSGIDERRRKYLSWTGTYRLKQHSSLHFHFQSYKMVYFNKTEAPLLIRPFLPKMTKSEIHAVMTGGFATIAGKDL